MKDERGTKGNLDASGGTSRRRTEVSVRLANFRGSRSRSAVALPELIALAASGLLLLTAIFSYFYFLRPQRARLVQMTNERQQLERELQAASVGVKRNADTQATVQEILGSLQEFETTYLGSTNDRLHLVDELNEKILRNKLRISGGMSYSQFEEAEPGVAPQPQQRAGRAKAAQSVFPGIGVTLTVEGTYANLRRFIRDVESDRHFVVIDAVELEGVTDTSAPQPTTGVPGEAGTPPPGLTPTVSRGALVSLRLDMAAYFRRLNAPAVQNTSQP